MDDTVIKKQCCVCLKRKFLSEFGNKKGNIYDKESKCKICKRLYENKRYRKRKSKRSKRQEGKNSEYGKVCRSFSAEKLSSHRKRFQVLAKAGIDVDFKGTDAENVIHAEKINTILSKAGLGDIREDRWEKLQ